MELKTNAMKFEPNTIETWYRCERLSMVWYLTLLVFVKMKRSVCDDEVHRENNAYVRCTENPKYYLHANLCNTKRFDSRVREKEKKRAKKKKNDKKLKAKRLS